MSGTEDDVVKTITRTITKGKARQGKLICRKKYDSTSLNK